VGTNSVLSIVLGYASGLPYEDRKINITGTFLLAGIASKTGKELFIERQLILEAQKSILNQHSRRESRVVSGNRAYTCTLATLQAVVSLGFLNNIL
jgi:hypothetical protein